MKKVFALFLVVLFLCGINASAFAEIGYVLIKEVISQTLDTGISITIDELPLGDNTVIIYYYAADKAVSLLGMNSNNKPEGTLWLVNDLGTLYAHFLASCASWDSYAETLSDGYDFMIVLSADDADLVINSAEKAEVTVSTLAKYLDIDL